MWRINSVLCEESFSTWRDESIQRLRYRRECEILQEVPPSSVLHQEPSYLWMAAGEGGLMARAKMKSNAEVCLLTWSGLQDQQARSWSTRSLCGLHVCRMRLWLPTDVWTRAVSLLDCSLSVREGASLLSRDFLEEGEQSGWGGSCFLDCWGGISLWSQVSEEVYILVSGCS